MRVTAPVAVWCAGQWRVDACRQAACAAYYDALDRDHALPSYAPLPRNYLDDFCRLPGGGADSCLRPPEP